MEFTCVRWEQLPQIPLYMDQVLLVLDQTLAPLAQADTPLVTAAMINNYVKMKLVAPPERKKYSRDHLARFVMICLLKKVLSMAEIEAVLKRLLADGTLEAGYDLFCRELELRLASPGGEDSPGCPAELAAAIRAVAGKVALERLLEKA